MQHLLFDHIVQIEMCKDILEDYGINCLIKNEFEESSMAGFAIGVPGNADLYVDDADYEKALLLLKDIKQA